MDFQLKAIGHIRTPFQTIDDCPRNVVEKGAPCRLVIEDQYLDGLFGLSRGDSIIVLYWLNKATFTSLKLPSRKNSEIKGIFALRTPNRPNPIGVAEIVIDDVVGNEILVSGLDCLDMTPLLDIKPGMAERCSEKEK